MILQFRGAQATARYRYVFNNTQQYIKKKKNNNNKKTKTYHHEQKQKTLPDKQMLSK